MPALPWVTRQPLESDRTYVVMSSKLPLQRSLSIPRFMRYTLAIRKQLSRASGLVGYSLDADLAHRTFGHFRYGPTKQASTLSPPANPTDR
jgi:hypothetical protein